MLSGTLTVPQSPIHDLLNNDPGNWIAPGTIAYVSQVPWLENASIQSNILFGLPLEQSRYRAVLAATALEPDLRILSDGDLTEIGARGINLSGGQRWRVTFARALYSRAEILVLDDIFSAVDAHTGQHLLQHALTGPLARGRTRILATHHAVRCLPHAAYSVRLTRDGHAIADDITAKIATGLLSDSREVSATAETGPAMRPPAETQDRPDPKAFVEEEFREQGAVKWHVYRTYILESGGWLFWVLAFGIVVVSQLALLGRIWWIKEWTSVDEEQAVAESVREKASHSTQFYLIVYVVLSLAAAIMEAVKCGIVYIAALRASRNMFRRLLHAVLHARVRWLDTVPTGRILNRFTADLAAVDTKIPGDIHTLLSASCALAVVCAAGIALSPGIAIAAAILTGLTLKFAERYLPAARELRRLEATARSPVLEFCATTLSGLGTVRAYGVVERFRANMEDLIDVHSASSTSLQLVTQWLAVRIGLLGAVYALATGIAIAAIPAISAPAAGLALAFALDYNKNIDQAVRRFAALQVDMNATERVVEYAEMDHEGRQDQRALRAVPAHWPSEGALTITDLVATYTEDLPPVLKGISLVIPARQRVGIVGRTGSGKSSLALALFRFLDISGGKIVIDGIDTATISLHDLRSRIAIIPQDPVLFAGTFRSNLDPEGLHTDFELLSCLRSVRLIRDEDDNDQIGTSTGITGRSLTKNTDLTLETPLAPNALNLSSGERQLLALARLFLSASRTSPPKILVLDEATSAVDQATDVAVQAALRAAFPSTTVLVIAHRTGTVADFERVVVLNEGVVVEDGRPEDVLKGRG